MNLVVFQLKKKEEARYYKTSHRRFTIKFNAINMNKEQCQKLEAILHKAIMDILPEEEKRKGMT